jgi:uncharacterized cupredoxin-like copper-binding protein
VKLFLGSAALVALTALVILVPATALSSPSAKTVGFRMVEWDILPTTATKSHTAGKITFAVTNAGKLTHEFVVLKTVKPAGSLARVGAREAPETGAVGEIGKLAPGETKRLTLSLTKGHYSLICNLTGHWNSGQFVDFYIH